MRNRDAKARERKAFALSSIHESIPMYGYQGVCVYASVRTPQIVPQLEESGEPPLYLFLQVYRHVYGCMGRIDA